MTEKFLTNFSKRADKCLQTRYSNNVIGYKKVICVCVITRKGNDYMDIDINDFETRYEIIYELLKHLEKQEVSKKDKKILYNIIINRKYGTETDRERFINRFNLTGNGEEYKYYTSYARSVNISSNRVAQSCRHLLSKIGREKNLEDLTKIQEINLSSRKNIKDNSLNKRGEKNA